MKILKLKAENIKKLKAIEITPDGNVVKISGKNAQGKSSILDSIMYALAGKKSIPEKVIREGEQKGQIELDLGDFIVTRSFTPTDSYLKVVTKDGAEYTKGQEKLSELIGALSFDPLEFANYDAKKQKQVLIDLLGIDTSELDAEHQKEYDERTEIGILGKQADGELKSTPKPKDDHGMARVDVDATYQKTINLKSRIQEVQTWKQQIEATENQIASLKQQLAEKQAELKEFKEHKLEDEAQLESELAKETERLTQATAINKDVDTAERYYEAENKVVKYRKLYEEKTEKIKEIKGKRDKLIADARMPIEGLTFNEDGILFKDIPFEQLSSAEKLKVSMAMAIAMNPELRIIRVMDGSLLDSENMKVIEEMAKDNDYQVWVEIVDESGKLGFYIEDGQVANQK